MEEDCTDTHSSDINLELEGAGVVRCPYHWRGSEECLKVFGHRLDSVEGDGRSGEVRQGSSQGGKVLTETSIETFLVVRRRKASIASTLAFLRRTVPSPTTFPR